MMEIREISSIIFQRAQPVLCSVAISPGLVHNDCRIPLASQRLTHRSNPELSAFAILAPHAPRRPRDDLRKKRRVSRLLVGFKA